MRLSFALLPSLTTILLATGLCSACWPTDSSSSGGSSSGGSSSGGSSSGSSGSTSGSDECQSWKLTYCKVSLACNAFTTQAACEQSVAYVICQEGFDLASCQNKLKAAMNNSCEGMPSSCGPLDVADRTEPYKVCRRVHQALCDKSYNCGFEVSLENCMANRELVEPCSSIYSSLPAADECVKAVGLMACSDALPDSCNGALLR